MTQPAPKVASKISIGLRCTIGKARMRGRAVVARPAHNPKVARCAQVLPPLYFTNHSSQSYGFRLSPKDYSWQKFQNRRFL